ncbi:MAG: hypothetical protein PHH47_05440 [Gallionella sp.]|nr:hypothetical protein [Gallionella sp.]MDD4945525.1 hypothetical protein [Gallionella sp.]
MSVLNPSLQRSLAAWGTSDFERILKQELESLDKDKLPLQQGLSNSNHVVDAPITAIILGVSEQDEVIRVRAGIFYLGMLGGCSCADDPTPVGELNEYCEIQLEVNRNTAETSVFLVEQSAS